MEEMSLNKIGLEIQALKKMMQRIQEAVLEDELEVSDEVVREVEESRKQKGKDLVSHEEVLKRYYNE